MVKYILEFETKERRLMAMYCLNRNRVEYEAKEELEKGDFEE